MIVLAQDKITNPGLGGYLGEIAGSPDSGAKFLSVFLPKLVGWIFITGLVIFFFIFLLGAISWITAGGDKVKLDEAKKKLGNGLIGVVILISTFAVVRLIETLFGVNILQIDLSGLFIA